ELQGGDAGEEPDDRGDRPSGEDPGERLGDQHTLADVGRGDRDQQDDQRRQAWPDRGRQAQQPGDHGSSLSSKASWVRGTARTPYTWEMRSGVRTSSGVPPATMRPPSMR